MNSSLLEADYENELLREVYNNRELTGVLPIPATRKREQHEVNTITSS